MYKKSFKILIAVAAVLTLSCKKSYDVGQTNAVKLANNWWVTVAPNGALAANPKHVFINTYNTSAQSDSFWVDDLNHDAARYRYKTKAAADLNALTFSTTNSANLRAPAATPNTATITEGKVIPNGGRSLTGVVTDSIYFKIKFSYSDTVFTVAGVGRTGFIEDDY